VLSFDYLGFLLPVILSPVFHFHLSPDHTCGPSTNELGLTRRKDYFVVWAEKGKAAPALNSLSTKNGGVEGHFTPGEITSGKH
jgi:hypothetical protein